MLNAIACKKATSENNRLTSEQIRQTVEDFVDQEKELARTIKKW